jgi:hypothetical protein
VLGEGNPTEGKPAPGSEVPTVTFGLEEPLPL